MGSNPTGGSSFFSLGKIVVSGVVVFCLVCCSSCVQVYRCNYMYYVDTVSEEYRNKKMRGYDLLEEDGRDIVKRVHSSTRQFQK